MSQTKHRDTAGQTESIKNTLSHAEPSKNTQNHPHTRTEGSNPSLSATVNPDKTGQAGQKLVSTTTREGLGSFTLAEFVRNLADSLPVEVPRSLIFKLLGHLESQCSHAEVNVSMDDDPASNYGKPQRWQSGTRERLLFFPHQPKVLPKLLAWIDKNPNQLSR